MVKGRKQQKITGFGVLNAFGITFPEGTDAVKSVTLSFDADDACILDVKYRVKQEGRFLEKKLGRFALLTEREFKEGKRRVEEEPVPPADESGRPIVEGAGTDADEEEL